MEYNPQNYIELLKYKQSLNKQGKFFQDERVAILFNKSE